MAAWVATADLPRLTAALGPEALVVRCDSLDALSAAVRAGAAGAVLTSGFLAKPDVADLASLIAFAPTTVFAGLATPAWPTDGVAALLAVHVATVRLGRAGGCVVRRPARNADWELLVRSLAAARLTDPVQRAAVAAVLGEVWGSYRTVGSAGDPAETAIYRLFAAAFAPGVDTLDDVAARLEVDAAAIAGWFVRRRLPSADRYVAAARLVRVAWTGQPATPGSMAAAVRHPHPEAPAHVHRAARRLRRLAAITAGASPRWSTGPRMLSRYRAALVVPFRDELRTFDPAHRTT